LRLHLISGFLGSGKTTAINHASRILIDRHQKVAVITNDQGEDLVDTIYSRSIGVPVEEVVGGCFCCNFDQLLEKMGQLQRLEFPEIIFAESVGTCTDLIATVVRPLARVYPGLQITMSVFADAALLSGLMTTRMSFLNDQVRYIYKKQLEESDFLVVNKVDLLQQEELEMVLNVLREEYPSKTLITQNSLDPDGIRNWLGVTDLSIAPPKRTSLEIDYDMYAEGESALAWLDEWIEIQTTDDSAALIADQIIKGLEREVRSQGRIGHLKFLLDHGTQQQKVSFTANPDERSTEGLVRSNRISLLINARVEISISALGLIMNQVVDSVRQNSKGKIAVRKRSIFKPGYPKPTYRYPDQ